MTFFTTMLKSVNYENKSDKDNKILLCSIFPRCTLHVLPTDVHWWWQNWGIIEYTQSKICALINRNSGSKLWEHLQLNFSEILNPKAVNSHALSVGISLFRGRGSQGLKWENQHCVSDSVAESPLTESQTFSILAFWRSCISSCFVWSSYIWTTTTL